MCAVLFLASSCASDTAPGAAGPDFTGELASALEPSAVPADTEAATAPPPSTSVLSPIEPAVPEEPAEDPATASTVAPQDVEGTPPSADPDSSVPQPEEPQHEEPQPEEPQPEETQPEDPRTEEQQTEEPQPEEAADIDEQPTGDAQPESVVEPVEAGEESTSDWQLEALRSGKELPGGGVLLFEPGDESSGRRLVAAYGHPSTPGLGVLGEQGPEAAVERLRAIAEGYGSDGSAILPTFEIIATVASASAGGDGDYSRLTDVEVIRPWIEVAAASGVYVVLDLQPGRSDFLSQAKLYEEFLRLPHVGLALDPEWRLKPDQVHLRQIGTVDAAEINQVVDWLAGIVREEALPQKLLIVHQFRFSMITNRELIETPPELAVLIHMDGQGSLGAKYNTWNTLTGEPDAGRFHWGWKNFYDEDSPMATPEQVLALSPKIFYVSFQ